MNEFESLDELCREFKNCFQLSLQDFLIYGPQSNIEGFNLCKFRDVLEVPEHGSIQDFIIRMYGEKADNLILLLLKGKETFKAVYERRVI